MQHFYRLPIRWRLFASFGVLLLALLGALLALQYRFFINTQYSAFLNQHLPEQLEGVGAQIERRLMPSITVSESLANQYFIEQWIQSGAVFDAHKHSEIKQYLQRLRRQVDASVVFMLVNPGDGKLAYYFYTEGGELLREDERITPDNPDKAWYFNFLQSGQTYELNLNTEALADGDLFIFVNYRSEALAADQRPVNVAGIGMNIADLNRMLVEYRAKTPGRILLADAQGEIQVQGAAGRLSRLDQPEQRALLVAAREGTAAVRQVQVEGHQLILGALWLPTLQRFLVIEIARDEIMRPIHRHLTYFLLIGLLLLFVSLGLLYPLANSLTRPIARFQRQINEMTAHLDLRQSLSTKDRAELGDLAKQINQLHQRIQDTVREVAAQAGHLLLAAERLTDTAGRGGQHAQQMAFEEDRAATMAAAVEQLSCSMAEITSTMEELSSTSAQIAQNTRTVAELASDTLDYSEQAAQAIEQQRDIMHTIREDNEHSLREIIALGSASRQISQVMKLIHELASKTKLIAFNAAIEASSAGGSGKRFAVVAAEIRRLADSVSESTDDIETQMSLVQETINRLNLSSEKEARTIQEGINRSEHTAQMLKQLVDNAQKTNQAATQISLSTGQQQTGNQQVFIALREIAHASAHNAQAVKTVSEISLEVKQIATDLRQVVDAFKL
ncbi:methyl-accepting chemotaxis protein [Thiorhodospira sibirica]|uniref:methyl-accepting chemotaxis protein n=1 Tax=Thiorhodospira sibirica TaxID=154347 RepID=UPI00022C17B7|nr:methyl-accepting chemotaxis protein [Thiorhodospira sibirica]